jgi:hypothetical protein
MPGNENTAYLRPIAREWSEERFFALGGHDNPLKRLNPAKKIQGNPSLFSLIGFARIWPGLAGF